MTTQADLNEKITTEDGVTVNKFSKGKQEVPTHIKEAYEQAQFNLRSHEPFLSCILNRMRLGYSPYIPTAAVSIQRRGVVLYLSEWFADLSPSERAFVLKHEALHILHGHLPRSLAYFRMLGRKKEIAEFLNICQDMAINPDCISLLPPGSQLRPENDRGGTSGCWPELYNLERGHSFDWYVRQLYPPPQPGNSGKGEGEGDGKGKGKGDSKPDKGSPDGKAKGGGKAPPPESIEDKYERWTRGGKSKPMDKHEIDFDADHPIEQPTGDEEYDESCKPVTDPDACARLNEHILSSAKKEYDETIKKGCGNIPGEYAEHLDKILNKRPISWLNKLQNMFNQVRGGKKKPTWKRKNRRGIPNAKGTKKGPKSKIFVILDTSGSMSSQELQLALSEIDHLARKEEVYEVQVDTRVASFRKRHAGDEWNVYGRGGTDMVPGFNLAKEEKASAIVCITDGGIFQWPEKPKVPTIWVSTQTDAKYPYGNVVYLTPQGHWWEAPSDLKNAA